MGNPISGIDLDVVLTVSNVAIVLHLHNASVSRTRDMHPGTTCAHTDGWRRSKPGLKSGTITGAFDIDDAQGYAFQDNLVTCQVKMNTVVIYGGSAYCTTLDLSSDKRGDASGSITLECQGPITVAP